MTEKTSAARTDSDRVQAAPIILVLGGEERRIKPLVIRQSREWKQQVAATLGELGGIEFEDISGAGGQISMEAIKKAANTIAVTMPEKLEDLVAAYLRQAAPSLDLEWLRDNATDREITDALFTMFQVTFPFLWRVGDLVKVAGALSR